MNVYFDPTDHTYTSEYGKEYTPVTKICGITPRAINFKALPFQDRVKKAASRGTILHKELQTFVETGDAGILPTTLWFKNNLFPKYKNWESEVLVYSDEEEDKESFAGQIDLVCQDENDIYHLTDFKTGGHETVDYQLSLYKRAFCKLRNIDPDRVKLHCIDAKNEEKIKVFDVRTIAKEWLDKLLHCYANGELYEEPAMELVGMPVTTLQKLEALENYYITLDAEMKALDAEKNALREDLYKAMQKEKMKNFSFGSIKAASVAPQIKESFNLEGCKQKYNELTDPCILWDCYYKEVITSVFDEELFKKEHPKEYAEFLRTEQKVKGYLKMTVNDLTEAK